MTGNMTEGDFKLLEALEKHRRFNALEFYEPYEKQLMFIALGREKNERVLFAGNQLGKTDCGAYEMACHLTGLYPPDWPGRRWHRPVTAWACGVSTTVYRDAAQTKLLGQPGNDASLGTGFIPRHCIVKKPTAARGGVPDAYDTVFVKHFTNGVYDGDSQLQFKSYEQGRQKFQGSTRDIVWWDEEPPEDIYIEGNARWSATNGMSYMTFTPLMGMSSTVLHFYPYPDTPNRGKVMMGPRDVKHLTDAMRHDLVLKYPKHEHEARIHGMPLLGSGRVFQVDPAMLTYDPDMFIPPYWRKIWGIDFGIGHPFGATLCLHDPEADIFYVHKTYRVAGALPIVHADAILRIAGEVPVAWPHDGNHRDKGSGEKLADQYRRFRLRMLAEHATFPTGGYNTEACVAEFAQRMGDGRFRVAADLADYFEELRSYHRDEDGKIVKERDDLLSASMKAFMMRRYAKAVPIGSMLHRISPTAPRPTNVEFDLFTGRPFQS